MKSLARRLSATLLFTLAAGCANDARREAASHFDAGRYEEGMATLDRAAREAPGQAALRADQLGRRENAAHQLVQAGRAALAAGRAADAKEAFSRALALQPGHSAARDGIESVDRADRQRDSVERARRLAGTGDADGARQALAGVLRESRDHREARALERQLDEQDARAAHGAPALRLKNAKPVNLEFRDANLKLVFDALSRSSGINFVFDKDVRGDAKTTLYARGVTLADAIDLILVTNQLEKKVLGDNALLIYPGTPQKQRDYQELVIRSFYLENADAKNTLNLLKTLLKTKDAYVDEKLNLLVMRDTPEAVRLAEKLVATHDLAEPEVQLEVEVIEVSHSRLQDLGIKWTDKFTFGVLDPTGSPFLVDDLKGIGRGRLTVNAPSATLSAGATDGASNVLASPRVRVKNREKARIMIGDRVPVISSQITPSTGNPVVTETVNYLDVGIKLDVEPVVHLDGDVAMRIGLEVSNLGERTTTQNGTIAYRVGTRNATTALRLRDGETQVLMGLIRDDDRRSAAKVPGLGDLPVASHLFGSNTTESVKTEIVLAVTPRIVRNVRPAEARLAEFYSGTENALRSQPPYARTVASGGATGTGATAAAADGASAAAPGVHLSWQGPTAARVGEEVTIVLHARSADPVTGASVQVGFDGAALEFVRVAEGAFMRQGGASTAMNHRLDASAGTVNIRFVRTGEGASGEGELAALTFRVKEGAPSAQVRMLAVAPTGTGNQPLPLKSPQPHRVAVSR